jgi:hypothetical protein
MTSHEIELMGLTGACDASAVEAVLARQLLQLGDRNRRLQIGILPEFPQLTAARETADGIARDMHQLQAENEALASRLDDDRVRRGRQAAISRVEQQIEKDANEVAGLQLQLDHLQARLIQLRGGRGLTPPSMLPRILPDLRPAAPPSARRVSHAAPPAQPIRDCYSRVELPTPNILTEVPDEPPEVHHFSLAVQQTDFAITPSPVHRNVDSLEGILSDDETVEPEAAVDLVDVAPEPPPAKEIPAVQQPPSPPPKAHRRWRGRNTGPKIEVVEVESEVAAQEPEPKVEVVAPAPEPAVEVAIPMQPPPVKKRRIFDWMHVVILERSPALSNTQPSVLEIKADAIVPPMTSRA